MATTPSARDAGKTSPVPYQIPWLALYQNAKWSDDPIGLITPSAWVRYIREGAFLDSAAWENHDKLDHGKLAFLLPDLWKKKTETIRQILRDVTKTYRDGISSAEREIDVKRLKASKARILPGISWGAQIFVDPLSRQAGVRNKDTARASGLIHYDVDDFAGPDDAVAYRDLLKSDPRIFACGLSISGGGVWFVVRPDRAIEDGHEDYSASWHELVPVLIESFGVRIQTDAEKKEADRQARREGKKVGIAPIARRISCRSPDTILTLT